MKPLPRTTEMRERSKDCPLPSILYLALVILASSADAAATVHVSSTGGWGGKAGGGGPGRQSHEAWRMRPAVYMAWHWCQT